MILHLVRHGRPAIESTQPAKLWRLRHDAVDDIHLLREAGVLPPREAMWFSSPEPKAVETAALLHPRAAQMIEGLREAERGPGWLGAGDFVSAVRRSFATEEVPAAAAWEPVVETRRRVVEAAASAIAQARRAEDGTDVVLVGHGTAWTLLVADLTCSPPDLARWEQMTMPDHCSVDPEAGTILSAWGQWRAAVGTMSQ